MEWITVIALIFCGLLMLIVEFFLIPGTTFVGVLGVCCAGYGIFLGYSYFDTTIGHYVLGGSMVSMIILFVISFKAGVWQKFALHKSLDSTVNEEAPIPTVGTIGIARSALRPMGTAEFEGYQQPMEVSTYGHFLDARSKIKVIKIEGRKIFVDNAE
jgi:membrane-bound ClpP family serine protease